MVDLMINLDTQDSFIALDNCEENSKKGLCEPANPLNPDNLTKVINNKKKPIHFKSDNFDFTGTEYSAKTCLPDRSGKFCVG